MRNIPAILNAFALIIVYLYLLGLTLNIVTDRFNIILIPGLIIGLGVEIYFFIRSLAK